MSRLCVWAAGRSPNFGRLPGANLRSGGVELGEGRSEYGGAVSVTVGAEEGGMPMGAEVVGMRMAREGMGIVI
jgi:hypothetical protein